MLKRIKLKIYRNCIWAVISLLFIFSFVSFSFAGPIDPGTTLKQDDAFLKTSGFEADTSVADVISMVIKAFLGLLGIIFVILIILAGYNWMTAAGEEEKVNKAKDTLKRAIIGLIIVVSAYAITYFVFTNLDGTGSSGMGPG